VFHVGVEVGQELYLVVADVLRRLLRSWRGWI
jgi:hypothetical protein